ncbi:proline dehydrogenase family protein [Negadavirga shengliensis]|uniref:Proline dehydrogenase family protein n=1 Tax=Negadavirga shengliensis TaxID=1389218 RepID=A0ABV9T8S1_9BACT
MIYLHLDFNLMETKPNVSFENLQAAFAHKTDKELKKMYHIFGLMHYPLLVKLGIGIARLGFKLGLPIRNTIKKTVFSQFCGGENIDACEPVVVLLAKYGVDAILDYSVEGKKDEDSFENTKEELLRTIAASKGRKNLPFTVFKISGIADTDILAKKQAGKTLSESESKRFDLARARVMGLCETAFNADVRIMVDGEESWFQDVVDGMVFEAMQRFNQKTAIVFNTFQMYRHDMLRRLKDAHHDAVAKGYFLGVKLVRGAYLEKERERAEKLGYKSPVHELKRDTDRDYDKALQFCVNNKQRVHLISGTHNELSNLVLSELVDLHGMKRSDERVYFAQLYGMSDHISFNLAKAGYNVVKYLPYGPVEEVLPYLSRRAEENSGISGQSSRELQLIKQEIRRRKHLPKLPKIA